MRDAIVAKLDAHIAAFDQPFVWGAFDCATFCAAWIERVTGMNPTADWPRWNSPETALSAIQHMGFADLADAASGYLPERPVKTARVGDIVCRVLNGQPALGICVGSEATFLGYSGLVRFGLTKCDRAWSVG